MTAQTLNKAGNGRGKKVVTRTITKVEAKPRGGKSPRGAALRDGPSRSITSIPVAELQTLEYTQPLTDKAKLFIKFWAQGESVATAAARAGYADGAVYAHSLKHLPIVKAMYMQEKALYEEASQMTRQRVMDGLLEGVEMAKLVSDPHAVITGWKTIGQMCGYFEPQKRTVDINLNDNRTMQSMSKMTDAELLKKIQEGVATQLLSMETQDDDSA